MCVCVRGGGGGGGGEREREIERRDEVVGNNIWSLQCSLSAIAKIFLISKAIYHISSVIRQGFFSLFSFQINPKKLDLSYKMDLDVWDCLGRI